MIKQNIEKIRARIAQAARRAGRSPKEVRLMGVTKTRPAEMIKEAMDAGLDLLGENYVQEAEGKILSLGNAARQAEWHMIGHLQRNKAKKACQLFDCIETVDSEKLARAVSRHASDMAKEISVLIQVNIAKEPQKSGVLPEEAASLVTRIADLPSIHVDGLMVIPPYSSEPEASRKWFSLARDLRDQLSSLFNGKIELRELSMGMSNDFEVAVEEGATIVRIGTSIFGPRGT